MPPPPPSSSGSEGPGRLRRAVRTTTALANRLTTGVAVLAGCSAGAGGLLWGLFWWPPSTALSSTLSASLTLGLVLSPASVLGLFYLGLRDLLALPDRLSVRTARTVEQSADTVRAIGQRASSGLVGRLWAVATQVWALRGVLLENRALLVRTGALLRFVTPGFLLLVVGAVAVTGLLIAGALLALGLAWVL